MNYLFLCITHLRCGRPLFNDIYLPFSFLSLLSLYYLHFDSVFLASNCLCWGHISLDLRGRKPSCQLLMSWRQIWQKPSSTIMLTRLYNCSLAWRMLLSANKQHDDVIKWKHFPRYWPFVRGIHRSPVNSPHKGQWRGALMFTLICARINGWVNNREAGDLRRYRTHYDVIVMRKMFFSEIGNLLLFW